MTDKAADPGKPQADPVEADSERISALQSDNRRLRDLLSEAGRLAELGRFAAKLNHELRQPLFAIKGLAQLLLEQEREKPIDAHEVRDFARHIVEQSERLTALVDDLRHLSLPASRSGRLLTHVSPVLLRVASLLDWRFRRGVILRTEIAADVPEVAIRADQLEQILINLLSNALDAVAGQPQPTIQIRVTHHGMPGGGQTDDDLRDRVDIDIADNGMGIALGVRARLFETFFTTKGQEAGTGLGLAVSREIARGAGGDLVVMKTPGSWSDQSVTCFRLTLPVAKDQDA